MPLRLRYPEFAPEGIASLRSLEHYLNASTALPAVLLELVRLRVSLVNGCSFCVGHHTEQLHRHNEPASRIEALSDWASSDAFTPRERAALAWADSVTDLATRHAADADYATVSTFFHEKDLVDLTLAVASINAWNRMSIAFGADWDPARRQKGQPAPPAPTDSTDTGANTQPTEPTPQQDPPPTHDVVNDDGGKVAQG